MTLNARLPVHRSKRPAGLESKRLLIVPVLHSEADSGSLAPAIRRARLKTFGPRLTRENADGIASGWETIRSAVLAWQLPWDRVRLYQDGLPICGRETEIVEALAVAGSANHRLLRDLMHRGAALMGTESADLVTEEYRQARERLSAVSSGPRAIRARRTTDAARLLRQRDEYIAQRIAATLHPGEIGILFIGLLHAIEPHLAADIVVDHPLGRSERSRP
jgi:hypothetical protein